MASPLPSENFSMVLLLFTVAGIAALVPTGRSQLEPIPAPLPEESLPGQPGTGQCWSSIVKTEGCFVEIIKALNNGQFGGIGTACCQAILSIPDDCWPRMFPLHPFFAPLLKIFCSGSAFAPAPPLF